MYNFTITSQLKAWIDRVCQAGFTFRYTPEEPVGLALGKRAIVAASRGGLYSTGKQARCDFQIPDLNEILAFIGIIDVAVVLAEGVNISSEDRGRALDQANQQIDATLSLLAASSPIGGPSTTPHQLTE